MMLKMIRESQKITQKELAAKSGVHVTSIARIECGLRSIEKMSLGEAAKLADALGVHAEELLCREDNQ